MVFWNQLEGNNVNVTGYDLAKQPKSPSYNMKMGFPGGMDRLLSVMGTDTYILKGAQHDIFLSTGTANSTYIPPSPTSTSTSTGLSIHEFTNIYLISLFALTLPAIM